MTTEGVKRAAIYARISSRDGKYNKVAEQVALCRKLAADEGYEVVRVFSDDGISGVAGKDRKGWDALLAAVPNGEFDVILARAQDRLSRDPQDSMKLSVLCATAGVTWHTAYEGRTDPNDAVGELTTYIRGWLGKAEVKATKQRIKTRLQAKRDDGKPGPGPRPFGYEKWNPKHPDIQPLREDEADLIRRGTAMLLTGSPRYHVTKMFAESGIKTVKGKEWHSAKVAKVLSRWRNAGWVEHEGEPYKQAIWPAIVSLEDVRNVRTILSSGRPPGKWKHPQRLCSGIARCRCGYQLVATGSKIGPSYRCGEIIYMPGSANRSPGPHVTMGAKFLDPLVRKAVVDAYFARPASSGARKSEEATLARLYQRRDELNQHMEKVQDGYERGIYEVGQAASKIAKARSDISAVDQEIADLIASSAHAAMLEASMNSWVGDIDVTTPSHVKQPDGSVRWDARLLMVQSEIRRGASREAALDAVARASWEIPDETTEQTQYDEDGVPWYESDVLYDDTGQPVLQVDPDAWKAAADRFDSLPLEQQRHLVDSLLTITVYPAADGPDRVLIEPKSLPR